MMSIAETREVARDYQVGAHSYSHESMGYEDDAFFHEDLIRCANFFRDHLQLPMDVYAFSNGSFRPNQVEALLAQGVRHVLLVGEKHAARSGPLYTRLTKFGDSALEAKYVALGLAGLKRKIVEGFQRFFSA